MNGKTIAGLATFLWLGLTYGDASMPGHDDMILGAHYYPHHLGDFTLLVIGGLAFWFGMTMLSKHDK